MTRSYRARSRLLAALFALAVSPACSEGTGKFGAVKPSTPAKKADKSLLDQSASVEIRGNRVEYVGREGRVTFLGRVVVTRGTSLLRADEVTTLKGANEASARGNVSLTDPERKVDLTCQELVYTQGLRQVLASGTCHLIAGEGESLTVVDSDEMEIYIDTKEAIARGSVRIVQGVNEARCGLAHLYGAEDRVALFGDPFLTRPPHEFHSDEVVSFLKEGRLLLNGNVRAHIHAEQGNAKKEEEAVK